MIAFIQDWVPHYRVKFFEKLAISEDVIIIHSGAPTVHENSRYKEIIVPLRRFGRIYFQDNLINILKDVNPKVVVAPFHMHNIGAIIAKIHFGASVRWVWWGGDTGSNRFVNYIRILFSYWNCSIVCYHESVACDLRKLGFNKKNLFVARNTVYVAPNRAQSKYLVKDSFVNVGSLDARKQNDVLIRCFKNVLEMTGRDLYLFLVGEGQERERLLDLVFELKLENRVFLPGKMESADELQQIYDRALASVSFGQAGLAVLQSMGFGVPFVTKRSAVSGGEKCNIIENYNGIFCNDDQRSLEQVMKRLVEDEETARTMGANAYTYYCDRASVDVMVEGFRSALSYGVK